MPRSRPRKRRADLAGHVYQLKITLDDVSVAVWRTVQVPGDFTLRQLHLVVQQAMGWQNAHLHAFGVDGKEYGEPSADFDLEVNDDRRFRLSVVAPKPGMRFTYLYDIGDGWQHEVVVEETIPAERGVRYPHLVAGRGACPPEDVGGPPGYDEFLVAVGDPDHAEHDEMLEWVGGSFDPDAFDPQRTKAALQRLQR